MSIFSKLLSPVTGIINSVIDKIAGDKMDEGDKARMKIEAQQLISDALQREEDSFREFVIEHSGAAKDMPRSIQILRGSVRPVITYATFAFVVWGSYWMMTNVIPPDKADIIGEIQALMKAMVLIVLGFWFGERLLTRTGIAQVLMGGKKK